MLVNVESLESHSVGSMTVGDLAACSSLTLRIAAGRSGLSRRLESVHAVYNPAYLSRISPHTLVLMMDEEPVSLKRDGVRLLRSLESLDMAGLGVGLFHRAPDDIPASMVKEADKLALPLITVPPRLSFQSVIQTWQQQVASSDLALMKRLVAAHESVLDISEADEVSAILARVASIADADAVLIDRAGRVLASCWRVTSPAASEALTRELWTAYTEARSASPDVTRVTTSRGHFFVRPVRAQGAVRQVLFAAIPLRGPMSSFLENLLDFIQRVLQLDAVARLDSTKTRHQERHDLLAELNHRKLNQEDVAERMQYLGFSGATTLRIVALHHREDSPRPVADSAQSSASRQNASAACLEVLEAGLDQRRVPFLSAVLDGTIVIAVPSRSDDSEAGNIAARELVRALRAELSKSMPGRSQIMGISEPALEPVDASRGVAHALLALERARTAGLSEVFFEDMEPELPALDGLPDEHLRAIADSLVETLWRKEPGEAERDLSTLAAYINHDLSVADTAADLNMHRNTLRRRLTRVSAVLDLDLSSFGNVAWVRLALMAHDVLNARRRARGPW